MPDKQKNRNIQKENREEDRHDTTVNKEDPKRTDNPRNVTENVSTSDNEAKPGETRVDIRKDGRDC